MSIYSELDLIIEEYVGINEVECDEGRIEYECADPALVESIRNECNQHLNHNVRLDMLSEETQACIKEWEDLLTRVNEGIRKEY